MKPLLPFSKKSRHLSLACGALLAGIFTGCASSKTPEPKPMTPVVMQLDWIYNAQFAGIFQAIEQGYFADADIVLEVRGGPTTDDVVRATLEEPKISFGSSESNVLIAEAADGADLKMLGTMFQFSPMGWMYMGGGAINEFTDLADKDVGVHADGWRVIKLLLQKQGADISNLNTFDVGYSPSVVIDGEADAMQCYYIDEYVRFQQMKGEQAKVFLAKDFGYDAYSQVVFTATETIEQHTEVVAAFMKALKMGWAYAFENPEATVDMMIAKYNPELERDYQLRSLAKIEDLMVPEPGALLRPMTLDVLQASVTYLLDYDLISRSVNVDSLLAQEFLPE